VTTQLITHPYHLPRDGGPALWHLGAALRFKATSEQTAGRMWAKELTAPRGMATPVHRHTREDEAFYVLDGEVSVYVDDQVVQARTGHFLWAPREVRKLGRTPLHTEERITEFERPHRMSYTVAGLPVRDYRCTVELTPLGNGTEIRWSGRFTAPRLLAHPLRALLQRTVSRFATAAAAAASPSTRQPT